MRIPGENNVEKIANIAKIIECRSVRARFMFSFMIGLPNSGTTTLLLKLLKRGQQIANSNGLDIYEAILFKDSVTGDSQLRDITDIDDKDDAMLLFSLAKFLVIKHYKVSISEERLQRELCGDTTFQDEEVSSYFREVCGKLFKRMKSIEGSHELKVQITRSHSFVNFLDMNVNKAAYEISSLLGCAYDYNVILFSVLNLFHYTHERLKLPLNLEDEFYNGKYTSEEMHLFELNSALEYFVHYISETFAYQRERPNTLLVGTDAGHLPDDEICDQMKLIKEYAEKIKIDKALSSAGMLFIKKDEESDYEKVKRKFFELVDNDKEFEVHIPMKFMFLRCFLHSTKKLFVKKSDLNSYAKSCHITSDKDVEYFIKVFCKCCSLLVIPCAKEYIILQPENFVKEIDKLYKDRGPDHFKQEDLKYGYLPKYLAKCFWKDPGQYEFYTSVLVSSLLMVEVKDGDKFFMPSLRSKYDTLMPTIHTNSLIVLGSLSLFPFHKQSLFVKYFQNGSNDKFKLTLKDCSHYNVIKFNCQSNADPNMKVEVSIRFRSDLFELFISPESPFSKEENVEISAFLKTACIQVLNNLDGRRPHSIYLAIVCSCGERPSPPHFIQIPLSLREIHGVIKCQHGSTCLDSHPAIHWLKAKPDRNFISPPLEDGNYAFYCH